jgi:hypothetical protein
MQHRHSVIILGAVVACVLSGVGHAQTQATRATVEALSDIVGTWQSDTTNGTSALSTCAWTPQHGAVICEQTLTTPNGVHRALNMFTFEPAAGKFFFYVLGQPGDEMRAVSLAIERHVWIYGGQTRGPNGSYSRTVNDFTAKDSYSWQVETSSDGERWTPGLHGKSMRVR